MAKAAAVYYGNDSYGRDVEVAKRVDGVWFERQYGWNGFGKAWSKWVQREEAPKHPTLLVCKVECSNTPEFVKVPADQIENQIEYGFNLLRKYKDTPRVRLPD